MATMRAGMTLNERMELREEIKATLADEAREAARMTHLAPSCARAQIPHEHAHCMAEAAGNGCLCPCHDPEE